MAHIGPPTPHPTLMIFWLGETSMRRGEVEVLAPNDVVERIDEVGDALGLLNLPGAAE